MYINRQEIKFKSKMTIRDSNPKIIYVGLVVVLVLTLIGVLSNNLSISYDDQQRALNYIAMGNTTAAMRVYETAMPSFGESLIIFALEIVGDISHWASLSSCSIPSVAPRPSGAICLTASAWSGALSR